MARMSKHDQRINDLTQKIYKQKIKMDMRPAAMRDYNQFWKEAEAEAKEQIRQEETQEVKEIQRKRSAEDRELAEWMAWQKKVIREEY